MKKAIPDSRGSTAKGNLASKTVDEYLASVPEPARTTLSRLRAVIRSVVPAEATEVISYRIPMFKYKGMLMGFAAVSPQLSLLSGRLLAVLACLASLNVI